MTEKKPADGSASHVSGPEDHSLGQLGRGNRSFLLFALLILVSALALRFWEIGRLELFVDEGGYILASVDDEFCRALDPVGEGKPLLGWIFKPASYLPFDPLATARGTVALSAAVTILALGGVLWLAAGPAAALLGMALWAFAPLTVFHERLALFDPIVATLLATAVLAVTAAAWNTGASKNDNFFSGLGGILFGLACLVKVSALLALPWFGLVYLALQRRFQRRAFDPRALYALGGLVLPLALLGRELGHLGSTVLQLDHFSSAPAAAAPDAHLATAFSAGIARVPHLLHWYAGYGGWPLGVLTVGCAWFAGRRVALSATLLALACLATLPAAALGYYSPYARYLIPDQIPFVLLLAVMLTRPWQDGVADSPNWTAGKKFTLALIILALAGWLAVDATILRQPRSASLPAGEIEQYITGPWSGEGLRELTHFLDREAAGKSARCVVFVHRYSRPGSYGLVLAARSRSWLTVIPLTLDSRLALGAMEAAIRRNHDEPGQPSRVFVLAEGPELLEPTLLRSAGVPFATVFDHVRGDGVSHFTLLEYQGAALAHP